MQIVQRSDWHIKPMPENSEVIPVDGLFSEDRMQRIKAGHMPLSFDDFWFIYWENDTLFFHRSRTGNCIYEVKFVQEGDRFRMVKAIVNRDSLSYEGTDAERDRKDILSLIDIYFPPMR